MSPATTPRPASPDPAPRARRGMAGLLAPAPLARMALLLGLLAWTAATALQRPALREAEAALARKDYPTALRRAEDDLTRHPGSRASALIAARSLSELIFADLAEPLYDRARAGGTLPLDARRDRARGLYFAKRFDESASACAAILRDAPQDTETLLLMTQLEFTRDRFAEGAAVAERLAAAPGGRFDGLAWLAINHHAARKHEEAAAAATALLEVDPTLKTYRPGPEIFYYEFAEDLMALNRPAEVRDRLSAVIDAMPVPVLLDLLGSALAQTGDLEGAEARFRESIRRQSGRINPWVQLGRLYNGQKRFAEAAEVLERAVAIDPTHRDSHYQLGTAYRFLGRAQESLTHFHRAEEIRRASGASSGGMGPAS